MTASNPQSPGYGELIAPHCQLCGGDVEGWICQTCEADFEEVDGLLVLKSDKAHASLTERLARMEEEGDGHTDAFEGVVRAKIEAERRLEEMRTNHDGALRLYSQWRSRAEKAEAELARLSRQDPREGAGETTLRFVPSAQDQGPAGPGEVGP